MNKPKHVGIIIDGNRRWAKERKKRSIQGHKEGYKNLKKIIDVMSDKGITYLSIYVFSTENWQRPRDEVDGLMAFVRHVSSEGVNTLNKRGAKIVVVGSEEGLPKDIIESIRKLEEQTKDNKNGTLVFCFNYGGQQEIARAATEAAKSGKKDITTDDIEANIFAPNIPPVDLIIRTGGEKRLSNFMLWRAAYSELYFSEKLWPDFTEEDLDEALEDYAARQRRFGS